MIPPDTSAYDEVVRLLETLGDDPDQVAATLREEEIRGLSGSVVAHPVCRWLTRQDPELCVVLAPGTVQVLPGGDGTRHGVVVPLPPAVRGFIQHFGEGKHPDLEVTACLTG